MKLGGTSTASTRVLFAIRTTWRSLSRSEVENSESFAANSHDAGLLATPQGVNDQQVQFFGEDKSQSLPRSEPCLVGVDPGRSPLGHRVAGRVSISPRGGDLVSLSCSHPIRSAGIW